MSNETSSMPSWTGLVAWWHAAAMLAAAFAFYFAPATFFGDAAYLQLGHLATSALAAVLFALGLALVMAIASRSRSKLRLVLLAVFLLDVQLPFLLVTHVAAVEIIETRMGVPALLSLVVSILVFAVPAGFALRALRENRPLQVPA
jgi:hypothetical protein